MSADLPKPPPSTLSLTARNIEDIFRSHGIASRRAKAGASAAWKAMQGAPDDEADDINGSGAGEMARHVIAELAKMKERG